MCHAIGLFLNTNPRKYPKTKGFLIYFFWGGGGLVVAFSCTFNNLKTFNLLTKYVFYKLTEDRITTFLQYRPNADQER